MYRNALWEKSVMIESQHLDKCYLPCPYILINSHPGMEYTMKTGAKGLNLMKHVDFVWAGLPSRQLKVQSIDS